MSYWKRPPIVLQVSISLDRHTCKFVLGGPDKLYLECDVEYLGIKSSYDTWLRQHEAYWRESSPIIGESSNTQSTQESFDFDSSESPHIDGNNTETETFGISLDNQDLKGKLSTTEVSFLEKFQTWLTNASKLGKIRGVISQLLKGDNAVELRIACKSHELERLPWEVWNWGIDDDRGDGFKQSGKFRVVRTLSDYIPSYLSNIGQKISEKLLPVNKTVRAGKSRILLILGIDSESSKEGRRGRSIGIQNLWRSVTSPQEDSDNSRSSNERIPSDWESLNQLKLNGLIELKLIEWNFNESNVQFRRKLFDKFKDERGWDVIVFAGHSCSIKVEQSEQLRQGGKIIIKQLQDKKDKDDNPLRPQIELNTADLAYYLKQVRGLKLMMFNSCDGLGIANFLLETVEIPQIVVMRERVWSTVAQKFLEYTCQSLSHYEPISQAVYTARQLLFNKKTDFPSGYLLPSIFHHPESLISEFSLRRSLLQEIWITWRLSRWQTAVVSVALLLGTSYVVQDSLMDDRQALQLLYRNTTRQIPARVPTLDADPSAFHAPSILLVSITSTDISQESENIGEAIERGNADFPGGCDQFQILPMDPRYIAKLIDRATELRLPIIGVNYIISSRENCSIVLKDSIEEAVKKGSTLIFAEDLYNSRSVSDSVANPKWTLSGDAIFKGWTYPTGCRFESSQGDCSFAYWAALTVLLGRQAKLPLPTKIDIEKESDRLLDLEGVILSPNKWSVPMEKRLQTTKEYLKSPSSWLPYTRYVLDFSLSPDRIFKRQSAEQFLNNELDHDYDVVIIAAGAYGENSGNKIEIPTPLSIKLGRLFQAPWSLKSPLDEEDPFKNEFFTTGEAQAYLIHQLINKRPVSAIWDVWIILIFAIAGKILVVRLCKNPSLNKKKLYRSLLWGQALYILTLVQIYVSTGISIPFFLPSVVFWLYVYPHLRRVHHVYQA